jgi:hypothetical protein
LSWHFLEVGVNGEGDERKTKLDGQLCRLPTMDFTDCAAVINS